MAANMQETFASSKLKVKRAKKHLAELESLVAAHLEANPPKVKWTPATEQQIAGIEVSFAGTPLCAGAIVGDVVHNLRAALDLMAVELASMNEENPDDVYFPFCEDADYLDQMIKNKKFDRAGPEAVRILRTFKPYKGGNAALRALHDLDVQDKHKTLIPHAHMVTTPAVELDMSTGVPVIIPVEGSLPQVAIQFPEDSPLAGLEMVPALQELVELVEGILETFAAIPR